MLACSLGYSSLEHAHLHNWTHARAEKLQTLERGPGYRHFVPEVALFFTEIIAGLHSRVLKDLPSFAAKELGSTAGGGAAVVGTTLQGRRVQSCVGRC